MTRKILLATTTISALVLMGCGGSGGSSAPPPIVVSPPPPPPVSSSATLSWQAPTQRSDGSLLNDLTGFKLYHGDAPDNMLTIIDISDPAARSYEVQNLAAGTHYFTVTAYDSQDLESTRPAPVSKTIN